jgi:hypothetical protein
VTLQKILLQRILCSADGSAKSRAERKTRDRTQETLMTTRTSIPLEDDRALEDVASRPTSSDPNDTGGLATNAPTPVMEGRRQGLVSTGAAIAILCTAVGAAWIAFTVISGGSTASPDWDAYVDAVQPIATGETRTEIVSFGDHVCAAFDRNSNATDPALARNVVVQLLYRDGAPFGQDSTTGRDIYLPARYGVAGTITAIQHATEHICPRYEQAVATVIANGGLR